jgi:hypothetical protein
MSATARADAAAIASMWEKGVGKVRSFVGRVAELKVPAWTRHLRFHEIYPRLHEMKSWIGLSTASLIAFLIGIGCMAGALMVGLLTAKTLVDWQAIQFYRAEWLLAATASFVAGILLKKPSGRAGD